MLFSRFRTAFFPTRDFTGIRQYIGITISRKRLVGKGKLPWDVSGMRIGAGDVFTVLDEDIV